MCQIVIVSKRVILMVNLDKNLDINSNLIIILIFLEVQHSQYFFTKNPRL